MKEEMIKMQRIVDKMIEQVELKEIDTEKSKRDLDLK